jgi:hypothetical protein
MTGGVLAVPESPGDVTGALPAPPPELVVEPPPELAPEPPPELEPPELLLEPPDAVVPPLDVELEPPPVAALTACWQADERLDRFCSRHCSAAEPPVGTLAQWAR